jgi:hypothetical protein
MAQACNSSYLGSGGWEDYGLRSVWPQKKKKVHETIILTNSLAWWHIPVILATQEVQIKGLQSKPTWAKM